MYCSNCGTELVNGICPKCGQQSPQNYDAKSTAMSVLSFFFPVVGLILYLVWKDYFPVKAKACGKMALISTIISVVVTVVVAALYMWALTSLANEAFEYAQVTADNTMYMASTF